MIDSDEKISQAIEKAKGGDRQTAKEILAEIVRGDPKNARAWYLLSQVVEKPVESVECLMKALEIDPDNLQAMERLERYQYDQETPKPKKPLSGVLVWIVLAMVACVGVPLCLLSTIAGFSLIAAPIAPSTEVDKQATIEQALAATITLIPTFTMAPTKTATASPSLTPTDTATKIPTVTPITAEPMAGAVNQAAVLGGPSACIPPQTPERGIVSKVIDGDTIDVVIGNKTFPVRYIGMDTLEMSTGGPMAMKAKVQNEALVYGKTVALYRDRSETDRYDRLLRYVMVGDLFINYDLIKTGYAEAKSYSPDTTCDPYFKVAEQEAQLAGLGLWAAAPEPSLTPMVVVNPPSKGGGGNCDPSYPTVCILPPPPDLDCGQIDYSNFKVLPPDPHNFDGDHDGVGCEG